MYVYVCVCVCVCVFVYICIFYLVYLPFPPKHDITMMPKFDLGEAQFPMKV